MMMLTQASRLAQLRLDSRAATKLQRRIEPEIGLRLRSVPSKNADLAEV